MEIPVPVFASAPAPPPPLSAEPPAEPPASPSHELSSPKVFGLLLVGVALALLVLGGLVVGSRDQRRAPGSPVAAAPSADTAAPDGERSFELVTGAAAVSVRTTDLGGDLYQINGPAPQASDDGSQTRLVLADRAEPVDLVLTNRVRWDLTVGGGADHKRIDLAGGQFRGIALHDGANQVDLLLPHPDGTLTVTLAGGAGRFDVHTAGSVPVRVRVGNGAGQVVVHGETHSGVAPGALFTPDQWDAGGDRIDLDATGGMNLLNVLS